MNNMGQTPPYHVFQYLPSLIYQRDGTFSYSQKTCIRTKNTLMQSAYIYAKLQDLSDALFAEKNQQSVPLNCNA